MQRYTLLQAEKFNKIEVEPKNRIIKDNKMIRRGIEKSWIQLTINAHSGIPASTLMK